MINLGSQDDPAVLDPTSAASLTAYIKGLLQLTGSVKMSTVSPTIDTAIYASGDLMGGKLSFTGLVNQSAGGFIIQSIVVADQDSEKAALDIVFFDSDPAATTFTDQAALDIADADALKIAGVVSIAASDYVSFNDNSVAIISPNLAIKLTAGATLYACLVCRSAPTYTAATDLQIKIKAI